jgi:GT2 family glycosyltransferase
MTPTKNGNVLAVLVVYKRSLAEVSSLSVLLAWLIQNDITSLRLRHLLIYDNSDVPCDQSLLSQRNNWSYVHDSANGGTAAAYSHAAKLAPDLKCDWLLLLDQDTNLPEIFMTSAATALKNISSANPVALVPYVKHGTRLISPARLTYFGSIKPIIKYKSFSETDCVTAISSGSLIQTSIIQSILPFPPELWLDYVDHWIFFRLHKKNTTVVAFDVTILHDLSIESPQFLSRSRLFSILDSETFLYRNLGIAARCTHPLRLIMRMMRYLVIKPELAIQIAAWMLGRIHSKR